MGVSFLFSYQPKTMEEQPNKPSDPGFLFSLNLMLLGGVLLLMVIITLNKLLNHYFSQQLDMNRGILYSVNVIETDSFKIYSSSELYLTWFACLLSALGLTITVTKLAKSWRL